MSNDVIASFAEPTQLTVTRYAAGAYASGRYVPGSSSNISITAAVIPTTPDELKIVASGQETAAGITIYSDVPLQTASESTKTSADVVSYDGKSWQVQQVQYRGQIDGLEHYKSVAMLEDGDG